MNTYLKGPEKVSELFNKITRNAFKNHGFANLKIIESWPQIVGNILAEACWPQKIQFPFGDTRRGVLYIAVSNPGLALSIKAQEARIIQKISVYFGYQAISGIRINISKNIHKDKASKEEQKVEKQKLTHLESTEISTEIEKISDAELKNKIKDLFESIFELQSE